MSARKDADLACAVASQSVECPGDEPGLSWVLVELRLLDSEKQAAPRWRHVPFRVRAQPGERFKLRERLQRGHEVGPLQAMALRRNIALETIVNQSGDCSRLLKSDLGHRAPGQHDLGPGRESLDGSCHPIFERVERELRLPKQGCIPVGDRLAKLGEWGLEIDASTDHSINESAQCRVALVSGIRRSLADGRHEDEIDVPIELPGRHIAVAEEVAIVLSKLELFWMRRLPLGECAVDIDAAPRDRQRESASLSERYASILSRPESARIAAKPGNVDADAVKGIDDPGAIPFESAA